MKKVIVLRGLPGAGKSKFSFLLWEHFNAEVVSADHNMIGEDGEYEFDVTKGHWWQMMNTKWTLDDYINYLEEPKMLINPWRNVKLFDNVALEWITGGPWYMTPVVTLPVACWYVI